MNSEPIRLFIADDHALFREGMRALLSATADIVCVGEAATGEEAVQQIVESQPSVLLMDINMPGINGIEATRRILRNSPDLGIIMVTMLEDDASIFAAMRAGARGYVLKGANHLELLQAIRAVAGGQVLFGPAIATRITQFFAHALPSSAEEPHAYLPTIEEMVLRHQGETALAITRHWYTRQPQGFFVFRAAGNEIAGFCHYVELSQVTEEDSAVDSALSPALAHVQRAVPPWPGEALLFFLETRVRGNRSRIIRCPSQFDWHEYGYGRYRC